MGSLLKLSARDASGVFVRPDPHKMGVLIYGANAMRVALKRQQLVKGLIGPQGEEEMRLTRLQGGELRRDSAVLNDAIKAIGFFPGPRVVLVEDANENCADSVLAGLKYWQKGDAQLIVIGGALKPTSKIRKAFEVHPNAWAIPIFDEPPTRAEVEAGLAKVGIGDISPEANLAIIELSKVLDPGDFHQFLEKMSLFCMTQLGPVTIGDVEKCSPQSTEAALDDVIGLVADLKTNELAPVLHRVIAQGGTATGLCIAALRHFRMLHTAACDPAGAAQGVGKLRPPAYGPRRDRIQRQVTEWGRDRLEQVISLLLDTDLKLRSAGQTAPQMAQVERCFIRISMMGKR
jgi:DNA polymerase-3 subunit delta